MIRSHTLWTILIGWMMLAVPNFAQQQEKPQGPTIYYVTAEGKPLAPAEGIQTVWTDKDKVTTLEKALDLAKAGDEVWILGYEMESDNTLPLAVYPVPEGGFKVKSGVQIFGGFSGKETTTTDRPTAGQIYRMRYRTVLTADTGNPFDSQDTKADKVNTHDYIFPVASDANRRADNRTHVLEINMKPTEASGNRNTVATVLNGLVIARGHANGNGEYGGGVYIYGDNNGGGIFRIERCFFIDNYGTKGGGVYVSPEVKNVSGGVNLIDRCAFFNNAAGKRDESANKGGAVCIDGQGYVFNSTIYNNENGGVLATQSGSAIMNCTITRNTGAGVDGEGDKSLPVTNTVIWGNADLTTSIPGAKNYPLFQYSAFPEDRGVVGGQNNIVLSEKNNAPGMADAQNPGILLKPKGPSFKLPSVRIGYDIDYDITTEAYPQWDWEPMEETSLVDKGSNDLYDQIKFSQIPANLDLNGRTRKQGTIDIGAYEFQTLAAGRRRYVKEGGTGKGTSWNDASGDLQKMIDELASDVDKSGPGEVWIAGGTYKPSGKLLGENAGYSVAFRMRDGISVYGGFLGKETRKDDRPAMDFPWEAHDKNSIVYLVGHNYNSTLNPAKLENNRWSVSSDSRHVVWFAPATYSDPNAKPFKYPTTLDRVCVRGGMASGDAAIAAFEADKGGGVYMNDANAYMRNCVVKESTAKSVGGGVYLKSGRIIGSLIYNCNAGIDTETGRGGGVFVDEMGMVLRSMVANNTADLGAGVYLNNADKDGLQPNYLVLSTSVVSNNTARINGGVYCYKGGVLTQNTITNNYCPTSRDAADKNASQTGGVYVNEYGTVINSVIWNNKINLSGQGSDYATDIPMFALNPSVDKVQFYNNAMSGANNAVWNGTLQDGSLLLGDKNTTNKDQMGPDFSNEMAAGIDQSVGQLEDTKLETIVGALKDVKWIRYYWRPRQGSNLWAAGLPIGQFHEHVLMTPELDITAQSLFAQKPSIGAFMVQPAEVKPAHEGNQYVFYIDGENKSITADGSSWDTPFRSLTEAVNYFAQLTVEDLAKDGVEKLVLRVRGQELWPRYAFSNEDPKTATLRIPVMKSGKPLVIEGSWQVEDGKAVRNPLHFRSIFNSNHVGRNIEDGNYHGVNIDAGAQVEIDGFHIINGYAASTASIQSGAGVLAKDGSVVTLRNCILENNTAKTAAAVDARQAKSLTMVNCVVNNNTNKGGENESVIGVPERGTCLFKHLSVVNNIGSAPNGLNTPESNSFAAGNTNGNTHQLDTKGEKGAVNFSNPTKEQGATLGFDTYLGGYSEFRPLTSSVAAGDIINKGKDSGLTQDITMVRDRDLGGLPDLGAFEAELPKKGRVYYVRTTENGGDDNYRGLSWEEPFATVKKAVETAYKGEIINGAKPQVWVAAGTYAQLSNSDHNCFEILDGVNVYGAFPKTGTPGMGDRHPFVSDAIYHDGTYKAEDYETILKPKDRFGRVLGQADGHNPYNKNTSITYEYIYVGEGNGDYVKSEAEYTPQEGGEYYFGKGNEDGYWKAASQYCDWLNVDKTDYYKYFENYERHIEWSKIGNSYSPNDPKNLIEVGPGKGKYNIDKIMGFMDYWYEDKSSQKNIYTDFTGSGYYEVDQSINGAKYYEGGKYHSVDHGRGNYIKVEEGKYHEVGKGFGNYTKKGDGYINVGVGNGSYAKVARRQGAFEYPTTWDGFTLREGKLTYALSHSNRNGGAGAAVFTNVTLKNCVVTNNSYVGNGEIRGGGVYCDEGKVVNCYVQNNTLGDNNSGAAYGAGIYFYQGTMYNCVIHNNTSLGNFTDGAGAFIENGAFFNNTVVYNHSKGRYRQSGGIQVYRSADQSALTIYNCISLFNEGFMVYNNESGLNKLVGTKNFSVGNTGGKMECYNTITEELKEVDVKYGAPQKITFDKTCKPVTENIFISDYTKEKPNLRILANAVALNMGQDAPSVDGDTIFLQDYTDMDFTDRIKDCRVDAGAYESTNEGNIAYKEEQNTLTYYVTQNGFGTQSGGSPEDAACAMKLQRILNHAGETAATTTKKVVVKVAGYPGKSFVYHANSLSNPIDPQSYSFVIPYGVTLMGGYYEGKKADDGTLEGYNWDNDVRNAAEFMTVLSAIKKSTTTKDVNGYHALTFGEKRNGLNKETVVDGVYLEDGAATSLVPLGDDRTRGGGAIVPEWGHLRNCVVRNNKAREGGGLYVLPGGLVTGCGIMQNEATDKGGGVYANNAGGKVDKSNRAHLISNTIVENKANTGGGIYLEDGAALSVNSVLWGNQAGSAKNVSGVVDQTFEDDYFTKLQNVKEEKWYPFNKCYIEQAKYPSNFGDNVSMTADRKRYFADYFTLKPYSVLLDQGMQEVAQTEMVKAFGLAAHDMQGIARLNNPNANPSNEKGIDVGAYAYRRGTISTDILIKRLFVSGSNNLEVVPGKEDDYLGRSFFTSFNKLEDAFDYINEIRSDDSKKKDEARKATFEILVAAGTYTPTRMRVNSGMKDVYDQRLNSFTVPYNVEIYGGFIGNEKYKSGGLEKIELKSGESMVLDKDEPEITALCSLRTKTDHNGNRLIEPWELAAQTILSGELGISNVHNAFHVVYSEKDNTAPADIKQRVLLDGLTIMKGVTHNSLQKVEDEGLVENEVGRGGGIFSKGVEYALANCRLLENKAVRGGGIFLWDANLYLFNCMIAGNHAFTGKDNKSDAFGGAIFAAATKNAVPVGSSSENKLITYRVRAINNLFANNSSQNYGGAIAAGNGVNSSVLFGITSMNNTFVRNKADIAPVLFCSYGDGSLINTLIWGNEGKPEGEVWVTARVRNCASDVDYHGKFADNNPNHNLMLSKENLGLNGPRFNKPTATPGAEGYDTRSLWNPVAISLATDNGYGKMEWQNNTYVESDPIPDKTEADNPAPNYKSFWNDYVKDYERYKVQYESNDYKRYSGPIEPGQTKANIKPIDIGCYEYQYYTQFSTMEKIYVDETGKGDHSGSNWDNATSDFYGAIVGAANPTQNADLHRTVYVKSGVYASNKLDDHNNAFVINTSNNYGTNLNLTIKGSCKKTSQGTDDTQDFSAPSYVVPHPKASKPTKTLMNISVNSSKIVTIEGFSFTNSPSNSSSDDDGIGVAITSVADGGKVVLRQSAFRECRNGVKLVDNALNKNGSFLAVNALFADNTMGLANSIIDRITLVNTTFANNNTDMQKTVPATYNSVAWNNEKTNMPVLKQKPEDKLAFDEEKANVVFGPFASDQEAEQNNVDILNGPKFRDPLNTVKADRDYSIRPSQHLLNKGKDSHYLQHALVAELNHPESPDNKLSLERDLYNVSRKVGSSIDIGASEYGALLQQIIYVKSSMVSGNADGSNWSDATGDLQGAVDLAGLFANSNGEDKVGYVFADYNVVMQEPLTVTLGNVKVYGGMSGEAFYTEEGKPVSQPTGDILAEDIVGKMLGERAGLLMHKEKSTLGLLKMNASKTVVDGFYINEGAVLNNGTLATSIVGSPETTGTVSGAADGMLYNALVYGNVNNVRAVNVTATEPIGHIDGGGNNRSSVTEVNRYVKDDHWKYQLNETDVDNLDKGTVPVGSLQEAQSIIGTVGHDRDLAGNLRVRGKVDNGCFETWDLPNGGKAEETDYPVGQSVVYVRSGKELQLNKKYTPATYFNPGFLLLEHQAGLRGNGNEVRLSNFAVERQLQEPAQTEGTESAATPAAELMYDMAVMPFAVREMEATLDNQPVDGVKLYGYASNTRAGYNYKIEPDKNAWVETKFNADRKPQTMGWLIEGKPKTKVRFYGRSEGLVDGGYVESSSLSANQELYKQQVLLQKFNNSEPWQSPTSTGNKFTHKENMGWNLFGSPYLCAMKYDDMEYGRVIYGYQKGKYVTIQTYPDEDQKAAPKGYIPAGDAVFTQTATLQQGGEVFDITRPTKDNVLTEQDKPYAGQQNLQVAIARQTASRTDEATSADVLQLKAVEADEARTDFDLGSDGVKWTNMTAEPQIYAMQNGGHYSLLSAVNREGRVATGVHLPEKGNFVFFLPKEVEADDYEVVLLHDAKTGRATDLTEESYTFFSEVAGDIEDRFSLSFVRKADDGTATIRVRRLTENTFRVEGTEAGDAIRIFSADGKVHAAATATGFSTTVEAGVPRVAIVEVKRDGRAVGVVKVK